MLLNRCGRGFALIILLAFSLAYIFDDMAILLAGGVLLTWLLGAYLLSGIRLRETIRSVLVTRTSDRATLRTGATVSMTAGVTIQVPHGMEVRLQEILPVHAVLLDGETALDAENGPSNREYKFRYRINPVVHGDMHFPGITVTMRDLFFEQEISLTTSPFGGPVLHVQPSGLFELPNARYGATESREIDKMSAIHGFGIRGFRAYLPGDDLRQIDWKISAKYGKYFVREYLSIVNLPPVVVVDLPWNGVEYPHEDFARMVKAVVGMVEKLIQMGLRTSVVFISGPNILHVMRDEKDIHLSLSTLQEWMHPVDRATHLYRAPDRTELRLQVRRLFKTSATGTEEPVRAFYSAMRVQYMTALQHQKPFVFSHQLARLLASLKTDEVYLFSSGCGDLGHIGLLERVAQTEKIMVNIRVPDVAVFSREMSIRHGLTTKSVEAF